GTIGDAVAAAVVLRNGADPVGMAARLGEFLADQSDLGPKQWPSLLRVTAALPRTASFKFRARDLTERGTDPAGDLVWSRADGHRTFTPA
ncbi:acyl-CoA synthetase, partial [Dietzia sp. DQ12-76]|nr:acyl-CoA synthetase [Dietzia sp. DQ12-76]